jgi:hypothetical protein
MDNQGTGDRDDFHKLNGTGKTSEKKDKNKIELG